MKNIKVWDKNDNKSLKEAIDYVWDIKGILTILDDGKMQAGNYDMEEAAHLSGAMFRTSSFKNKEGFVLTITENTHILMVNNEKEKETVEILLDSK